MVSPDYVPTVTETPGAQEISMVSPDYVQKLQALRKSVWCPRIMSPDYAD